jgi:ribosomal protein S1
MSRPIHAMDETGWAQFVAAHTVGDVIDGRVVHVVPFGSFIRTSEGVDGLAPQSAWPTLQPCAAAVRPSP